MSIENFYNKTVSTERMEGLGGGSKRQEWVENLTDVSMAIHPESPELSTVHESAFYNRFKGFCAPNLDIEIGDRILDGADIYSVIGKKVMDDAGINQHMRLALIKGK